MATTAEKPQVEEFQFQAEMEQLLHLIVHALYTHREIFLRELISNASDALNKIRFRMLTDKHVLDPDADLKITIEVDPKEGTFAIEDSGIGMTREELIREIGTVARSGTLEFLKQLQQQKGAVDASLIGQFGVGFYSVFMVAEEVTIETRHADPESRGYRWRSRGTGTFSIEEIERPHRGTRISFKLKEDAREFSEPERVKQIIKRYSNFVDFPIYLGKEQVNRVTALWQLPKGEIKEEELAEFYKFIANDFNPPLAHLHLSLEGAVSFKALLFIPETAPPLFLREDLEKSVHLYSRKVLIQEHSKELLPEYLRFVRGVVDSEDVPLNVSREWVQSSPVITKIRQVLTGKILSWLEELAKNEPRKYLTFYRNFGSLFKMGVNADFEHRDRIVKLLRFDTTQTEPDEPISLQQYVERMKSDQKAIYYLSGEHRDLLMKNPKLEYFLANQIEVILLTDPVDVFVMPSIGSFEGKPIQSIEQAELETGTSESSGEALSSNLADNLLNVFKQVLGDRVEDVVVSRRLVNSPVILVAGKEGLDSQMEKMMKLLDRDFKASKKVLEINPTHPLIKNLARLALGDGQNMLLHKCILQLYQGAQLLEGHLESPAEFVQRMTEIMQEATK